MTRYSLYVCTGSGCIDCFVLVKMINFVFLVFAFLRGMPKVADELAVLRYYVDDDDVGGNVMKHYLSVLSPRDFSVIYDFDLPFEKNQNYDVAGSSCHGLLHFHNFGGQSVVCNLTTKKYKLLPLPELKSDPDDAIFYGVGFGYDASSNDYKVIRTYVEHFSSDVGDEEGIDCYEGFKEHTQVYSLKNGDDGWREIEPAKPFILSWSSLFVEKDRSIYWTSLDYNESETDAIDVVLSFHLGHERFDSFSLPPTTIPNVVYELLEHRGSLAVIGYDLEVPRAFSSMVIWEWEWDKSCWNKFHIISLSHVDSPVGLWEDKFLFLEAKSSNFEDGMCKQIEVYDLGTTNLRKLDIYSYDKKMNVLSYSKDESELISDASLMRYTQYTIFSTFQK